MKKTKAGWKLMLGVTAVAAMSVAVPTAIGASQNRVAVSAIVEEAAPAAAFAEAGTIGAAADSLEAKAAAAEKAAEEETAEAEEQKNAQDTAARSTQKTGGSRKTNGAQQPDSEETKTDAGSAVQQGTQQGTQQSTQQAAQEQAAASRPTETAPAAPTQPAEPKPEPAPQPEPVQPEPQPAPQPEQWPCLDCGNTFSTYAEFVAHYKNPAYHAQKVSHYWCNCGYDTTDYEALKAHMLQHVIHNEQNSYHTTQE